MLRGGARNGAGARGAGLLAGMAGAERERLANLPPRGRRTSSTSDISGVSELAEDPNHYLDVYLRKNHPNVDMKLTPEEIERLVYRELKIPEDNLVGVAQGDLRYVEIALNVSAEPWRNFGAIWIREGLTTSNVMPARERMTFITLHGAPLKTTDRKIEKIFSAFGELTSAIEKSKPNPEKNPLPGLAQKWNGTRQWTMKIQHNIPNFMFVEGRRCRVYCAGQIQHCTHCGDTAENCPGNLNFEQCKRAGGTRVRLEDVWNQLYAEALHAKKKRTEEYLEALERANPEAAEAAAAIPRPEPEPKKNKPEETAEKKAEKSEGVELFKVPNDARAPEVWTLLCTIFQIDRINIPEQWRVYQVKARCWLVKGMTLEERATVYRTKIKMRNNFNINKHPQLEEHNLGNQSGLHPPIVPLPVPNLQPPEAPPTNPLPNPNQQPPEVLNQTPFPAQPHNTPFPAQPHNTPYDPSIRPIPPTLPPLTENPNETQPVPRSGIIVQPELWNNQLKNLQNLQNPPDSVNNQPLTSTMKEGSLPNLIESININVEEDEHESEFAQQKSRGYKKRSRHNSGNSSGNNSRSSTVTKPSPKKAHLNTSMFDYFSPKETIYEEARKLTQSKFGEDEDTAMDIEGYQIDLHTADSAEESNRLSVDAYSEGSKKEVAEEVLPSAEALPRASGECGQETQTDVDDMETNTSATFVENAPFTDQTIQGRKGSIQGVRALTLISNNDEQISSKNSCAQQLFKET